MPKYKMGHKTYGISPLAIEDMADEAQILYGHPAWAEMILESQWEVACQMGYDDLRTHKQNSQLSSVMAILHERAERGHWDTACYKNGMDAYLLGRAREKLGEPRAPIGTWEV